MAKAYFAAGCFWGVQQRFSKLLGVTNTTVGYMGGTMHSPDYRSVCTGQTGHAEVVEVEYDAAQVDFATLMSCFFEWHDPTQSPPRAGYRYTISDRDFPANDEQRTQAQKNRSAQPIRWPQQTHRDDDRDRR